MNLTSNEIMIWGTILIGLVSIVLILLIHSAYQKQLRLAQQKIQELKHKIEDLEEELRNKERRMAFRLDMPREECTLQYLTYVPELAHLENPLIRAEIENISRTGMKVVCQLDLPVREDVFLQTSFVLKEETFMFRARILRKEVTYNETIYGLQFVDPEGHDMHRLSQILQKIEIEKNKKVRKNGKAAKLS